MSEGGHVVQSGARDLSLTAKLDRAELIYQKSLQGRQGLIKKFGPTPKQIAMCVFFFSAVSFLFVALEVDVAECIRSSPRVDFTSVLGVMMLVRIRLWRVTWDTPNIPSPDGSRRGFVQLFNFFFASIMRLPVCHTDIFQKVPSK